jgi:hypothetical protein
MIEIHASGSQIKFRLYSDVFAIPQNPFIPRMVYVRFTGRDPRLRGGCGRFWRWRRWQIRRPIDFVQLVLTGWLWRKV